MSSPPPPMSVSDALESILEDDLFLRLYPTYRSYRADWDAMGGEEALMAPDESVIEFYAERMSPDQALHLWFTYNPRI